MPSCCDLTSGAAGSDGGASAVDRDGGPGHILRARRAQERDDVGNFLRLRTTAEQRRGRQGIDPLRAAPASCASCVTWPGSLRSAATNRAEPPSSAISLTTRAPRSASRPVTITRGAAPGQG